MTSLRRKRSFTHPAEATRWKRGIAWFALIALALFLEIPASLAQAAVEFHRTLTVDSIQPVTLDVELSDGDLQIVYGRDGQVSISAIAKTSNDARLEENFFSAALTVEQQGNAVMIRHAANPANRMAGISGRYRIDVPYRTEVTSKVEHGHQNVSGVMGPVRAVVGKGDIKASYITKSLHAEVGEGNLDFQVIGERVEAVAGRGNISCARVLQGVTAETGDGDVTLMVVGSSSAKVRSGHGRIDVGGARGSLTGSTAEGDLHVKATPHDDWKLSSVSGNVRLEFPPAAKVELEASSTAGEFQIDRDDMTKPAAGVHRVAQQVNGGGKRIEASTEGGKIVIQ